MFMWGRTNLRPKLCATMGTTLRCRAIRGQRFAHPLEKDQGPAEDDRRGVSAGFKTDACARYRSVYEHRRRNDLRHTFALQALVSSQQAHPRQFMLDDIFLIFP